MLSASLALIFLVLLIGAAVSDTALRIIPNVIPAVLLLIGLCLRLIDGSLLPGLIVGSIVFVAMFVLWSFRLLGGGDVKLLTAVAEAIPPDMIGAFLLSVTLAGGVLAVVYLGLRVVVSRPAPGRRSSLVGRVLKAEGWRISRHGSIPYAVAIAAGGLFILLPGFAP